MNLYNFIANSEKNKAIFVVSLIVITLAVAFCYEGITLHKQTIDQVILDKEKSIDAIVNGVSLSYKPYEQRLFSLLSTRKEIIKAFSDRDRDALYRLSLPLYNALKRENEYLHVMHFHLPDGRTFLRMHNPGKFGDDLRLIRPAVQHVHKTKTPLACYEIGIHGAFYRIIQPVYYQGSYVGSLEIGIKVHAVLESLKKQIPDPITTFFVAERLEKVAKANEHEFLSLGGYILNTHNVPLYKQLPSDFNFLRDNQRVTIDGNSYLLHAYPIFKDYMGETIGGFIVMQDISQALTAKRYFIFRSLLFACFMLTISLLVLFLTFGKLIDKLERSKSSLTETVANLGVEVDERKHTQMRLYESKKEWERTFDAIGDIVTIMNSDLKIIKANQAAYKMFNVAPGALVGKFCYEIFRDQSYPCENCPGVDTINDIQVCSSEIEHPNLGKNFLITTSPVPDVNGNFTNIIHIAKDITETKLLETQLRQAQKMEAIGTLAGGISHDFNNILTAIFGYSQLIMMKAEEDDEMLNDLMEIINAAERAKDLVTQILTFSRQTEQEKRPIQVSLIVKEALKLLRSSIPTTIEIKQSLTSQGNILADSTQIHQIVMNLCTNAYHAMFETGGILEISLQDISITKKDLIPGLEITPGEYICLSVSDNGCGIDKTTMEKIFEPYFTTKEVGKGTGLGLAVVHGIITEHQGYINVYSEPGQSTTFHVYLPTVKDEPAAYLLQTDKELVRGGSERIMFIDDEDVIVALVSETLNLYGYEVTIFKNGVEAAQNFEKHPDDYDIVITDMSMPRMTGIQVTKKIKKIRPDLPVILCSGYSATLYKEEALAAGVSKYIQKPLVMDDLAIVIRELLDMDRREHNI